MTSWQGHQSIGVHSTVSGQTNANNAYFDVISRQKTICGYPQNIILFVSEYSCLYCLKCTKFGQLTFGKVTKIAVRSEG